MKEDIQIYSTYDHAVVDFVRGNLRWHKKVGEAAKVPCVFATPERAFAEVAKRVKANKDTMLATQKKYPLPFISIDRASMTYDPRRDNRAVIKKMAWNTDRTLYFNQPWPSPMIYLYTTTFWTRNLHDLDDLGNQLYFLFMSGPIAYLLVKHPFPMGNKLVYTTVSEDRKLPVTETPNKQRVLRRAITLRVEGWLVPKYETTPVVRQVITEIRDMETEDVLETITVP